MFMYRSYIIQKISFRVKHSCLIAAVAGLLLSQSHLAFSQINSRFAMVLPDHEQSIDLRLEKEWTGVYPEATLLLESIDINRNIPDGHPDMLHLLDKGVNTGLITKDGVPLNDIIDNTILDFTIERNPGDATHSLTVNATAVTSASDDQLVLKGVYPSSSPGIIFIEYVLPSQGADNLRVEIYSSVGRRLLTCIFNEEFSPGHGRIPLDVGAVIDLGNENNGVYFARLYFRFRGENQVKSLTAKMILLQ